jgi:uroporphyrinogen decarboxylase
MTGKERMTRILKREKADRIGLCEHFWNDTHKTWLDEGTIGEGDSFADIFGLDVEEVWPFNLTADLDFKDEVLAETEETITYRDGNGAVFKKHKLHDSTPEHIDFLVKEKDGWEQNVKSLLTPDPRRINFEIYRNVKAKAAKAGRFFVWKGGNVFESIKSICGHENMLVGMALDPDWVLDMALTYAKLTVELQKILFEKEEFPDGIWFCEDMGFKLHPFMSPEMYRDLIKPAHKVTFDYAHSKNMPVVVHSCGFVEPLVPDMIDAGMNCLQAMEVKAGMDLLRLHRLYGDRISFIGGIDVRVLCSNNKKKIDTELEAKIPVVKKGYNYAVHSDHSIPKTVNFETYRYFTEKALKLGAY